MSRAVPPLQGITNDPMEGLGRVPRSPCCQGGGVIKMQLIVTPRLCLGPKGHKRERKSG